MPADPPAMTFVDDLAAAVPVQDEATVSRTVLTSTGARVVVFSFDVESVEESGLWRRLFLR